jgi:mediator of RNA polymerase II transcription subunit 12
MKDLANPVVPLRRLSRTIPHGIRGKLLLDQCINKSVPINRALWLARCVGANEIRAFKRKGASTASSVGGEIKWMKDWTVAVQQFVENIVTQCGTDGWREKMDYAIRLSTNLYSEQLLDQEVFIDWVLTSIQSSTIETLPIWFLILQIYLPDMVQSRKIGTKITNILLAKVNMIQALDHTDIYAPLLAKLSDFVKDILLLNSGCAIDPKNWVSIQSAAQECLPSTKPELSKCFADLCQRNSALRYDGTASTTNDKNLRRQAVNILDRPGRKFNAEQWLSDLNATGLSTEEITQLLLEWATTPHRTGFYRIYAAVRLIRILHRQGFETDQILLDYISSVTLTPMLQSPLIALVAELVRSSDFSVARYLQWLIARGALVGQTDSSIQNHLTILTELPCASQTRHVKSLRKMLLSNIGQFIAIEQTSLQKAKSFIGSFIPELVLTDSNTMIDEITIDDSTVQWLRELPHSVKNEVALLLRHHVRLYLAKHKISGKAAVRSGKPASALPATAFFKVRSLLEILGDFSILADVLQLTLVTDNVVTLGSIADTLNYHLEIFRAVGSLKPTYDALIVRFVSLKSAFLAERGPLCSILDLSLQMDGQKEVARQIRELLSTCEHRTAVSAYSPVSDHMGELLQSADGEFLDEVEQQLASGNSMDIHTMKKMFDNVVGRIMGTWDATFIDIEKSLKLAMLLCRIKSFGKQDFERFMLEWTKNLLSLPGRPSLKQVLWPVVAADCISNHSVVEIATEVLSTPSQQDVTLDRLRLAQDTITLVIDEVNSQQLSQDYLSYRFSLLQHAYLEEHSTEILYVMKKLIELDTDLSAITAILKAPTIFTLLKSGVCKNLENLEVNLVQPAAKQNPLVALLLSNILTESLGISPISEDCDPATEVSHVLEISNDFSIRFCQLRLRLLLESKDQTSKSIATPASSSGGGLAKSLFEAINLAIQQGSDAWLDLVSFFGTEACNKIRAYAEDSLMQAVSSSVKQVSTTEEPVKDDSTAEERDKAVQAAAERSLAIIEAICQHASTSSPSTLTMENSGPALLPLLTTKMTSIWEMLASIPSSSSLTTASTEGGSEASTAFSARKVSDTTRFWIKTLLRLAIMHKSASPPEKPHKHPSHSHSHSQSYSQPLSISSQGLTSSLSESWDLAKFTITLISLLQLPAATLSRADPLYTTISDTAAIFADTLDPSPYAACVKFLTDAASHTPLAPAVRFIFSLNQSTLTPNMDWLQAIIPTNGASSSSGGGGSGSGATSSSVSTPKASQASTSAGTPNASGGVQALASKKMVPYPVRRWEMLNEPTPAVGGNDTWIPLGLMEARRVSREV